MLRAGRIAPGGKPGSVFGKVGNSGSVELSDSVTSPLRPPTLVRCRLPDQRRSGARPPVYVAPGTTLPCGAQGRNVRPVTVEGEPWLAFSFNFPWRWDDEPWKLVAGALRRFLKDD